MMIVMLSMTRLMSYDNYNRNGYENKNSNTNNNE